GPLAGSAVASSDGTQLTVEQWSKLVWEPARQGDRSTLDTYLRTLPEHAENDQTRRFREAIEQRRDNLELSLANRAEARNEARDKMTAHLESGEISQALTTAVEVQTLAEDREAILEEVMLAEVIRKARQQLPLARREGDWLLAYELLYRLNVLYEHSGIYQQELDRINRRLSLLSYYAPERLHELRRRQADRFGEEPMGEFNPALAEDWKQRLEGIDSKLVRSALEKAAREHIDNTGWRPLIVGGLDGMRIIATMPALSETYPSLGDPVKVKSWLDYIGWCSRLLGHLVDKSTETIALPDAVIYREFGDGAMAELDQFSEIVWPNKFHRFRQSTHGSFVGVGILIRHDDKRDIMVVSPLEGTPAYFSGVKPQDRIVEVDGGSTSGWSLNDAVDRITGPKGTTVTLGLRRDGFDDPLRLAIVRDIIKIRSVAGWWKRALDANGDPDWDWYIGDTGIAYVRLTAFNEDTYNDLKTAWREIRKQGDPLGLIVDLRYNPGGLLTSAVDVSNLFIREGVIVSGEDRHGERAWPDRRAEANKAVIAESGLPTVVLINQGSASASEIVAGSMQAHGAGLIVGMRSFGKGSVQTVHPISRRSLLKLTTQYYRLPPSADEREVGEKGRLVHRRPGATIWGVDPDVEVITTPKEIKEAYDLRQAADILVEDADGNLPERPDISELLSRGLDPQLETALVILQAKALGHSLPGMRHAMVEEPVAPGG
ncbi:MAG: S41 family peptidase, partial [Planctomycetota bacterium]